MGFAKTTVLGNVGNEPELRYTKDGVAILTLSIAVNKTIGSKENRRKITEWYRGTIWRTRAEALAPHIHKGDQVLVEGTVKASPYIDKNGEAAASLELQVDEFVFANSGGNGDANHSGAPDNNTSYEPPSETDDIPF